MSEFLHEVSSSIMQRERYFERRQRTRSVVSHGNDYDYIIIPEIRDALRRVEVDRRYNRLFGTSIYVQEDLLHMIPQALETRLERDSEQFFMSFQHTHGNAPHPEICSHYAIRQAVGSWMSIDYQCLGCNQRANTRGPIVNGN